MRKVFASFTVIVLLISQILAAAYAKEPKSSKGSQYITGILTEVTQTTISIRTQDGKESAYMRGFKLKIPEKAGKGSLVTVRINPILNVVKSIELGTGKKK